MQRFILSKWTKTAALLSRDMLKPYIPQTVRMTKGSLKTMLDEHHMVYIKPDVGTFGNGVIRVECNVINGEPPFRFQIGERIKWFTQYDSMYESILKWTKKKSYLVQKGIHLLKYQKRRFDIRVMVQQNLHKQWEASGLIGRVAHPNKIVTNYHSGGTPKDVEVLLAAHLGEKEKQKFIEKLRDLGVVVAAQLQQKFPGIKEIGVDIAVDKQFKPWILEVNTKPDPYIFQKLQNKAVFRKIIRYVRAYRQI